MESVYYIALTLGFLGSLHCVGMCGSLMVYHFSNLKNKEYLLKFIIYHFFRILAYALLGMMFGQLGFIGNLLGFQKAISLISGIVLIYIAFSYFFPISIPKFSAINFYSWIHSLFHFSSSSFYRFALAGFANGFLPCGFSFIAITFSITTYSMLNGFIFMFIFGLATVPALFVISVVSQKVSSLKINFNKYVMPVLALMTGVLLILRTMNLGIPYV
ncbi:MAG: sulfite exporter TauE/SafE family protein, partial [Bacteroidia bacterium]|nr:sulfite exporter TauE/SafE family protein [Bacteroidia bacterium]